MRRIMIIVTILVLLIASVFYYRHSVENNEQVNREMFDVVMSEKMRELYVQAQDWSEPMQFNVQDKRLKGDYKILSEFVLKYWANNIELRNAYLRSLKAAKWDQFLDIDRLDADRKSDYQQSTQMLKTVKQATLDYQQQSEKIKAQALAQVQALSVKTEMRDALHEKLVQNFATDPNNSLIATELKIVDKAEALFEMLKTHPWENQDGKILFYKDSEVKKLNRLYQDILSLNASIEQKKSHNAQEIEGEL